MKTYLFLLAWIQGSDSADGEETNVNKQSDLLPEFLAGNDSIFAREIVAPNKDVANVFGSAAAFHDNYTGANSLSVCLDCKNLPPDCEYELDEFHVIDVNMKEEF